MKVPLQRMVTIVLRTLRDPRWTLNVLRQHLTPPDPEAARIIKWSYGVAPRVAITEVFPGIEETDITLSRTFDRSIGTSLDVLEILMLVAIVKFKGAKRVLEIGTYDGNTALNIAANTGPGAVITTVDLPPDWKGDLALDVPEKYKNVTKGSDIGRQYRNSPVRDKIQQIYGDSAVLDWTTFGGPFDVIFIDGCHNEKYVRQDTRNAIRCLTGGGVIIWHDYGEFKDVSEVVDETAREMIVHAIRGTRLAVGITAP